MIMMVMELPGTGLLPLKKTQPRKVEPVYFDGLKFNDIVTIGDFSAIMRAFTYPDEFLPYEGVHSDQAGCLSHWTSHTSRFGLSFQTRIGNDVEGVDLGYKIHLLYKLTAIPTQKSFNTMALDIEPSEFEWTITAIPEFIERFPSYCTCYH